MTYCTVAEAKREGATGTDTEVGVAIEVAQTRIDQFTGEIFEPKVMTIAVRTSQDGRALLPYRLTSEAVTSVTTEDGTLLSPSTYKAYSSLVDGEVDALGFGAAFVGANILVVGLEPWTDTTRHEHRLRVTASFGWSATPPAVRLGCAKLAAEVSRSFSLEAVPPSGSSYGGVSDTDPEGNVVPVVPPFPATVQDSTEEASVSVSRTTGLRSVDAMLIPYRRYSGLSAV